MFCVLRKIEESDGLFYQIKRIAITLLTLFFSKTAPRQAVHVKVPFVLFWMLHQIFQKLYAVYYLESGTLVWLSRFRGDVG